MQVTQKILVTGATGRHGGTGAYVARRLREEGHSVRVLARVRDERSAALERAGFEVHFGDLRDRNSLLTAMEGIDQATFCFPVAPGIVEATAAFASALRKSSLNARVVVMSMIAANENSPSELGRAQWLAEEVMQSSGLKLCVLRVAALFFENIVALHGESIRLEGVLRNCFGDAKSPWISGDDAGELMVAALLHPEQFETISYPPGAEALTHSEIAEVLAAELSRPVRFENVSREAWRDELLSLAERSNVVNASMARHISALAAGMAARGGGIKPPTAGQLERQIGRRPTSFREFVHNHRGELTFKETAM